MNKLLNAAIAAALTGVVMFMTCFTCFFMLHQPKMPDELNDFRKYAE